MPYANPADHRANQRRLAERRAAGKCCQLPRQRRAGAVQVRRLQGKEESATEKGRVIPAPTCAGCLWRVLIQEYI